MTTNATPRPPGTCPYCRPVGSGYCNRDRFPASQATCLYCDGSGVAREDQPQLPDGMPHLPSEVRRHTSRGFRQIAFVDRYDRPHSIQKSSLATEDCIWLGGDDSMHLTRDMVRALLPILTTFADTGELP